MINDILEYPDRIAHQRLKLIELARKKESVESSIKSHETRLKAESGNKEKHPDLTNKTKRSAWVEEQKANDEYFQQLLEDRRSYQRAYDEADVELERLRNAFRARRALSRTLAEH